MPPKIPQNLPKLPPQNRRNFPKLPPKSKINTENSQNYPKIAIEIQNRGAGLVEGMAASGGTIIAYLRHASGGGVATPGWQHLRRYQPGADHNRVPTARCSFHSPHHPKQITARHRHSPTARNKPLHGIGTRPPPETNHCTASDIVSNHGIGF